MKITQVALIFMAFSFISCENETLPTIHIKTEGPLGWDQKEPCTIVYADRAQISEMPGKIKYRGGSSSAYFKHSFALELEKKFSFDDLPHDDDWILNANYIDKTFMRHKISYDLFREMSARNVASRSAYVQVSLNDTYEGLYVLMEEINGGMIGLDKKDSMSMVFKDPPIFYSDTLAYVQDTLNYYQQKFPKIRDSDKTAYIEEFKHFLFNAADGDFASGISDWVDIASVIDWHIILLFSNNSDGIMKNFYLYKIDAETPFRFAIWDYDHSFGRDGDNEHNLMERPLDCNRAVLLRRLSGIPETGYSDKMKRRWFELRERDVLSVKNFEKHIAANDKRIKNEVARNFEKWPVDGEWYFDGNGYAEELDLMREFVRIRIDQLDAYFGGI